MGAQKTLCQREIVVLGTEATEWNSMSAESLVRGRLEEACEFAGRVKAITQLLGTRETEAL